MNDVSEEMLYLYRKIMIILLE